MSVGCAGYVAVRIEGRLLPPELLERSVAADPELPGSQPEHYHLAANERLGDAASRAWEYLRGVYQAFRDRLARLPDKDPATTETRERWLLVLLKELGFGQVPFARGGLPARGTSYPVSHRWQHVPVHLTSWHAELDVRALSRRRAPQSMLQDFLNASDGQLWGILSNGRLLRILRDSTILSSSCYIEFDLETIFASELYSDFLLLYAMAHQSRFELLDRADGGSPTPADCWLERWRTHAMETGIRARDQLRDRAEKALEELGTGLLEANRPLRDRVKASRAALEHFHHELLRVIYQLIFLFVIEDRGVLLDPRATAAAADHYRRYFSTARLRRVARRRPGDQHIDLWPTLAVVFHALGSDDGLPELGLPALGGLYFRADRCGPRAVRPAVPVDRPGSGETLPDLLDDCVLPNSRLLAAIRLLAEMPDAKGRPQRVDYRQLDGEELGSILESLLELVPQPDPAGYRFWLALKSGNIRKTTGAYYTPAALIETILDATLDPLIEAAAAVSGAAGDLLKLRVCDPACGSGSFLVAAARRIASRYAAMKCNDEEPLPQAVTAAMREVVARCIYGVEINQLAAELAQMFLWLESVDPGKPLAYLDSHVKVGDALLGATPALLEAGLPDAAFQAIEGDDPAVVSSLRRQNEKERAGQGSLFGPALRVGNARLALQVGRLAVHPIQSQADVRQQARRFRELAQSPDLRHARRVADAWCAAFVWPKRAAAPAPITTETLRRLDAGDSLAPAADQELDHFRRQYKFFHWHLEFPDIFRVEDEEGPDCNPATGWQGGFSCVIGNPPWERIKLQELEFFAARRPEIVAAPNAAARKKLIKRLAASRNPDDQQLYADYRAELRKSAGKSHLLRGSGRYPLTGRGDINTYAVFAETARTLIGPAGRSTLVLPTGIATDGVTAPFFRDLVSSSQLVSFLDFENEAFLLSRAVHHSFRFCLLAMSGQAVRVDLAGFAFGLRHVADLPGRRFTMAPGDLLLANPNTGTVPLFRSRRDAEITLGIYHRVPVLRRDSPAENPWGVSFLAMFHMANDSGLFQAPGALQRDGWKLAGSTFTKDAKRMLPLYEAKMIHHFDHRFGTYEGQTSAQAKMGTLPRPVAGQKADAGYTVRPRYWVPEFPAENSRPSASVSGRLESRKWGRGWLLGWRDIARSSDERTLIPGALPRAGAGHTFPLLISRSSRLASLYACLASFVVDYVTRQKVAGTHITLGYLDQLPVLPPGRFEEAAPWAADGPLAQWVEPRVLELSYTAWDMRPFARDLGDAGPPFGWDEERRLRIRAELDAAFFHLYGIGRDDAGYIMDSFGAFRRNDPERFTRTKSLILQAYEAMAIAIKTAEPYQTVLDPPPGRGPRCPDKRG